jgi:hypothetical protein
MSASFTSFTFSTCMRLHFKNVSSNNCFLVSFTDLRLQAISSYSENQCNVQYTLLPKP